LASIYSRTGHIEDARLSFLRAAEFDPNLNAAFADLSVTETTVGHFDQALHWARRMFALAPNVSYAYYHVGIPLILLAANDPAERWLLDAERRMPTYQRVQMLIASLDCLRGRGDAAMSRARRSVASQPENQEGQNLLPEFALMTGAPDAASLIEGRFKTAPEARTMGMLPETFRTLRAFTLIKAGDSAAARPLLDASLALSQGEIANGSEFPEERMEIAAVHALRGERDDAMHWLEEAYRAGWRLYRETGRDPLFASLRMDPAFRDLLQRMEHDVTAMRERAHPDDLPTMPPASAESSR
jgi:tetratricopeptide (TPR) repeat protein